MNDKFIVGSKSKSTGEFSISRHPVRHATYQLASAEAQRLANKHTDKIFMVMKLDQGFTRQDIVRVDV